MTESGEKTFAPSVACIFPNCLRFGEFTGVGG